MFSSCWCKNKKVNVTSTFAPYTLTPFTLTFTPYPLLSYFCICSMKTCLWKNKRRLKSVCLIVKATFGVFSYY
jgi:hypothetical protein